MLKDHLYNRPNLRMTGGGAGSEWLFPSSYPGKHLEAQHVMKRLRGLGIHLLGARNSAIQNLVADVPLPWLPNSSATATKSHTTMPKSRVNHGRGTPRSGP